MAEFIEINKDPEAQKIFKGFKFISLTVKNSETGEVAWKSENWGNEVFTQVMDVHFPKKMLSFPAVGREIVFSTEEVIKDFRIEQRFLVHGSLVEQFDYKFGFVIPGSESSWETIVEAAGEGKMLPAEFLSGNMLILTTFYSGSLMISRSVIKVYYD